MKKRIPAFLPTVAMIMAIIMMAAVSAACSGRSNRKPGDPAKAMLINQAMPNTLQTFVWGEFQRHKDEYGIEMTQFSGASDASGEIAAIEQAIEESYDVIFINTGNIEAVAPALTRAHGAGIVIGAFVSEMPENHHDIMHFFCGSDDYFGSRQAGEYVSRQFPGGARFVEIGGQDGDEAQINRRNGFREGIAQNIVELDSQNAIGGWNPNDARAIMEGFLMAFGDDIDIVWCHWDQGAGAAIGATQAAGRNDIFIIGVDGGSAGLEQVRAGTQSLSIGQDFSSIVIQSLINARKILDGEGDEVVRINIIPHILITSENVNTLSLPEW